MIHYRYIIASENIVRYDLLILYQIITQKHKRTQNAI